MGQMIALKAEMTNRYPFPPPSVESLALRDLNSCYLAEIHHPYLMEAEVVTLTMVSAAALMFPDLSLSSP